MTVAVQRCTLPKEERLHCKKDIAFLLAKGKFRTCRRFRYCFIADNGLPYSRMIISVPKKLFKRAVKRNLLKRRIRESYRLQKNLFPENRGADILFIYNSRDAPISAIPFRKATSYGKKISGCSKMYENK